jgi:hypothetical protein
MEVWTELRHRWVALIPGAVTHEHLPDP